LIRHGCPVPKGAVPAYDLNICVRRTAGAKQTLVTGAVIGGNRASQTNFQLLEDAIVLVDRFNGRLHSLIESPAAGEQPDRIVILTWTRAKLFAEGEAWRRLKVCPC
jgi:hypothetical protein